MSRFHPSPFFTASLLFLALATTACDSSAKRRRICDRADAPSGCGAPCSVETECAAGLFCDEGTCTAECSPRVACESPLECSADGRCVSSADGGAGVDASNVRLDGGGCGTIELDTHRAKPNVIVIVDRSGSMGTEQFPPGSGVSRWDALRTSLIDPSHGLLFALESSVRFGFVTYRNLAPMPGCAHLSVIPARLGNADQIASVYRAMAPFGPTPTGDAIWATLARVTEIVSVTSEPTIFVLATDGEPNTCEDSMDEVGGRAESVEAVASAYRAGFRTFVLSVGADVSTAHLQDVANAGLGRAAGDAPATFWVATDAAGLNDALSTIIGDVVSCDIELVGTINPEQACRGVVSLDDRVLECRDVSARAVDVADPGESVDAVAAFIDHLETRSRPAPGLTCTTGLTTVDRDGIDVDTFHDTFMRVNPGSPVCFDIVPRINTSVEPTLVPQLFRAHVHVVGDGFTPLDDRVVYFLVPPRVPDPGS